jgi:hypothetical protein
MKYVASYIAWFIGAIIGWYCGATLLIRAIGIGTVFIVAKVSPIPRLQPLVGALAIQFGHGLWMLVGGIMQPDGMKLVIYDLILLAIGLVWLMARPGLVPVLLLGIYQLYAIVKNGIAIDVYSFGSVPHKSLVASIALRLAAIIALYVGYQRFRKNELGAEKKKSEIVADAK